jgi:diguanylate cyclase (GGDEF)-like protein
VLNAERGDKAWDIVQREAVDVIISDWVMPDVDGIELCRRVRSLFTQGRYIYFMLMTSLEEPEGVIDGMEGGADDFLRKPVAPIELRGRLIAAERVATLHQRLRAQKDELERLNKRFFEEGRIDAVTGINNRLRFDEDIQDLKGRVERYGHSYALALFDVDFFKQFNDTLGHVKGDETLRRVAQALKEGCRGGDSVYRYGGEEFVMVLAEQTVPGAGRAVSRHLKNIQALAIPHDTSPFKHVTLSAGLTALNVGGGRPLDAILQEADRALYFAKSSGRNRIAVATETGPSLL